MKLRAPKRAVGSADPHNHDERQSHDAHALTPGSGTAALSDGDHAEEGGSPDDRDVGQLLTAAQVDGHDDARRSDNPKKKWSFVPPCAICRSLAFHCRRAAGQLGLSECAASFFGTGAADSTARTPMSPHGGAGGGGGGGGGGASRSAVGGLVSVFRRVFSSSSQGRSRRRSVSSPSKRGDHRGCAVPLPRVLALLLLLLCLTFVVDLFVGAALRHLEYDIAEAADAVALPAGTALAGADKGIPWMQCDCLGKDAYGNLSDLPPGMAFALGQHVSRLLSRVELTCTVCATVAAQYPSPSGGRKGTQVGNGNTADNKDQEEAVDTEIDRWLMPLRRESVEDATNPANKNHKGGTTTQEDDAKSGGGGLLRIVLWPFTSLATGIWNAVCWCGGGVLGIFAPNTKEMVRVFEAHFQSFVIVLRARSEHDAQTQDGNGEPVPPATRLTFLRELLRFMRNKARDSAAEGEAGEGVMDGEKTFFLQGDTYMVQASDNAKGACRDRSTLERFGLPLHALPWLRIRGLAYRTKPAWEALAARAANPAAAIRTVATAAGDADDDAAAALFSSVEPELSGRPEITVGVVVNKGSANSYFCADMPNISTSGDTYYTASVLRTMGRHRGAGRVMTAAAEDDDKDEEEEGETRSVRTLARGKSAKKADDGSPCHGCSFQCVHPRLLRTVQRYQQQQQRLAEGVHGEATHPPTGFAAAPPAASGGGGAVALGAISWDVQLEDVDAGRVRLPGEAFGLGRKQGTSPTADGNGGHTEEGHDRDRAGDNNVDDRIVTRADLFTCKLLNPRRRGASGRDNAQLLLSTDAWISHFNAPIPFFTSSAPLTTGGGGGAAAAATGDDADVAEGEPQLRDNLDNDKDDAGDGEGEGALRQRRQLLMTSDVPKRLLPLHTAAIYGESYQSFPDYALRQGHWEQFDEVFLPHAMRQPDHRLFSPTGSHALPSTAATAEGGAALQWRNARAATAYQQWMVGHLYLREMQLIVLLNQQLRIAQAADPTLTSLTYERAAPLLANMSGVLPRLALEVLSGADPLLLPMVDENLDNPALRTVAWRPPNYESWSAGVKTTATTGPPPSFRMPFSPHGRIPAIAAAISHCWHGRLRWLSELSRYYPVHNFGRCTIPDPEPMPGDAAPTPGIPQRAHYAFPPQCKPALLEGHHNSALGLLRGRLRRERNSSAEMRRYGGKQRPLSHLTRDHELRCVLRKYRYIMSFENSIEDDYVTEKVYNGLLSGALPLYVGAMNIQQYVPRSARRKTAAAGAATPTTPSSPERRPFGLPLLPILQMFPILNESATLLEDRRILVLHEKDEAAAQLVLSTHATVLRARAAERRSKAARLNTPPLVGLGKTNADTSERNSAGRAEMGDVVANALESMALMASHHTQSSHYLLYNVSGRHSAAQTRLTTESAEEVLMLGKSVGGGAAAASSSTVFDVPLGTWPPADGLAALPEAPTEDSPHLDHTGGSLSSFLKHVHQKVLAPQGDARRGAGNTAKGTKKANPTTPAPRRTRAVKSRADRGFNLAMNSASDFAKESRKLAMTTTGRATGGEAAAAGPYAHRVERFADDNRLLLSAGGPLGMRTNSTTDTGVTAGTYEDGVTYARGSIFSRNFLRRRPPHADAMVAQLAKEPGPPMNGFAQLATYLRALDENPRLVEEEGYMDWWQAESMADFGEPFLNTVYMPHPICSICAAALEKKEAAAE